MTTPNKTKTKTETYINGWAVAQRVKYLPCKCEDLSLDPVLISFYQLDIVSIIRE